MSRLRAFLPVLVGLMITIGLDQWIKYLVVSQMTLGEKIDILPMLSLLYAHNDGIAFSMLSSFNDIGLIVLTLMIILFVSWLWYKSEATRKLAHFGFLLVIGGAIGNLIDRARFHYVVDYVYFHIDGIFSFAIFNLADAFITIGAILIILDELIHWYKEKRVEE